MASVDEAQKMVDVVEQHPGGSNAGPQLEIMGRELKCAICLSLFRQAAALSCNHTFCNFCILQSLKRASCCPICKLPTTRREVRAAPHMDNLVGAYCHMESVLGMNFFASQPTLSEPAQVAQAPGKRKLNKCPGKLVKSKGICLPLDNGPGESSGLNPVKKGRKRRIAQPLTDISNEDVLVQSAPTNQKEELRNVTERDMVSPLLQMKGVVPAKKRVHVPQCGEVTLDGASPSTFTKKRAYRTMLRSSQSPILAKATVDHGDKMASNNATTSRKFQHQKELNGEDQKIQKLFGVAPVHIPLAEQAQRVLPAADAHLEDICGLDASITEGAPAVQVGDVRSTHQHDEKVFSPNLSPFFWLKDEGDEELEATQAGASVPLVSQSKFNALQPAFSDLKDADDRAFEDEVAKEGDTCDSDIFDWTQRPCSPELNCSPSRDQVGPTAQTAQEQVNMVNGLEEAVVPCNLPPNQSLCAIEQDCCVSDTIHLPGVGAKTASTTYKRRTGKKGRVDRTSNAPTGAPDTSRTDILLETVQLPQKQKVQTLLKTPSRTGTTELLLKQHPDKPQDFISERLLQRNTSTTEYQKGSEEALWPESESNRTCLRTEGSAQCTLTCTKSIPLGQRPMEKQRRKRKKTSASGKTSVQAVVAEVHTASVVQKSLIGKKGGRIDVLAPMKKQAIKDISETATVVGSKDACGNAGSVNDEQMELQERSKGGRKGAGLQTASPCAFCRLPGDSKEAGPMAMYEEGPRQVYVHKLCAEWAPEVYFEGDKICNLSSEVGRGQKIKCSSCGKKGAALGCCITRCHKSFHYSCARALPCRWQLKNFVMLCPDHVESKFPGVNKKKKASLTAVQPSAKGLRVESGVKASQGLMGSNAGGMSPSNPSLMQKWPPGPACKWVLCGSALDSKEKERLAEFSVLTGASLVKVWSSNVTHVIAGTDEQGAARRTLKYLMATLEGKWIVQADWMQACMSAGHGIKEDEFEVKTDIHGMLDGPKHGRTLAAAKAPKLFAGFNFYFCGDFVASYKADLQALAIVGGGTVLHRKPLPPAQFPQEKKQQPWQQKHTIVIYNAEVPAGGAVEDNGRTLLLRFHEADAIAAAAGAVASSHTWLLDSAAACKLQPLEKM